MRTPAAFLGLLLLLLLQAAGARPAAQPREGYVVTADGVRLFYRVVGEGPETLVAVHGGPGNSFESILADLEPLAKGRRVIYYDQRGNGRSDLITDPARLAVSKHVEDLEAVRAYFKLDRMTLLGNSWGGLLVGYYAAAHPGRVARMVLHCPAAPTRALAVEMVEEIQSRIDQRYTPAERKRFAFVADTQNWLKAEDPRPLCREFYQTLLAVYLSKPEAWKRFKGDVCAGPAAAVRRQQVVNQQINNSLGDWNLTSAVGAVKAPVLVVHGEDDVIPYESSEAWARAYPEARLLLVKDAGHVPQIEQPEVFFAAVETFLRGDWPAAAKRLQPEAGKR